VIFCSVNFDFPPTASISRPTSVLQKVTNELKSIGSIFHLNHNDCLISVELLLIIIVQRYYPGSSGISIRKRPGVQASVNITAHFGSGICRIWPAFALHTAAVHQPVYIYPGFLYCQWYHRGNWHDRLWYLRYQQDVYPGIFPR